MDRIDAVGSMDKVELLKLRILCAVCILAQLIHVTVCLQESHRIDRAIGRLFLGESPEAESIRLEPGRGLALFQATGKGIQVTALGNGRVSCAWMTSESRPVRPFNLQFPIVWGLVSILASAIAALLHRDLNGSALVNWLRIVLFSIGFILTAVVILGGIASLT